MERDSMFLGRKNQYCENDYTTIVYMTIYTWLYIKWIYIHDYICIYDYMYICIYDYIYMTVHKMTILQWLYYKVDNLQIQCDPYQITNDIFHRTRTKKFTIYMETQTPLNSQSSLEKEEWNWRNQHSWLQIILQSCSH